MANFVSPGVYVIEKDISDYTPSINPTVVGVLGFADKGKPNKATLVTSQTRLIEAFGRPREELPGQAIEGSLEMLETTNNMYFVRALDAGTAGAASAMVLMGGCPAVAVSANSYGVDNSVFFKVQVTDNNGVSQYASPRLYAVPAGTKVGTLPASSQAQAMQTVFGGGTDNDKIGFYYASGDPTNKSGIEGYIVGNFAGSSASLTVQAYATNAYENAAAPIEAGPVLYPLNLSGDPSGLLGNLTVSGPGVTLHQRGVSSVTNFGTTLFAGSGAGAVGGAGVSYATESLYPGLGYNLSTLADGTQLGNSVTVSPIGGPHVFLNVNDDGATLESFKVGLVASGHFVEDVINIGAEDNLTSDLIKGNMNTSSLRVPSLAKLETFQQHLSALGSFEGVSGLGGLPGATSGTPPHLTRSEASRMSPRFVKFIEGTYPLTGGKSGTASNDADKQAAALIGGVSGAAKTGMQAFDFDLIPITLGIVPGLTDERVQNSFITLAEKTGNFLTVFGTPIGIGGPQDAIDYSNGMTPYRTSMLNSSYACMYYPQVKVFNPYYGKDIWMDPAIYGVRQMGFTDTMADLWFAPAGYVRGRLTKPTQVEVDLNQGDRDSLYSGGNAINPIVNFPNQGITIFGQRTLQRTPTALDRINVRRMMVYIKRIIEASTRRFVFEPNDKVTQEAIEKLLTPFFEDIKRRRGITQFAVICDETVNTPVRVDRNELWCRVLVKPTKAAEILVFELNVTNQQANIGS